MTALTKYAPVAYLHADRLASPPERDVTGQPVEPRLPAGLFSFFETLGIAEGDDRLGADGRPLF